MKNNICSLILLTSMLACLQLQSSSPVSTQITSTNSAEASLAVELQLAIESLSTAGVEQYIAEKKPVNKAQAIAHVDALIEKHKYRKLSWANAASALVLVCGAGAVVYTAKQIDKQKKLLPNFTFKTGVQLLWKPALSIFTTAAGQPSVLNQRMSHIEQSFDNLGKAIGFTLCGAVCLGSVYAETQKKQTKLLEIKKLLESYTAENSGLSAAAS